LSKIYDIYYFFFPLKQYKDYDNDGDDAEFEEGALVEYCRSKVVKPSAVLKVNIFRNQFHSFNIFSNFKQPPLVVRRPSSAVRIQNTVPIAPKPALPVFGRTKATTEMRSPLKTTSTQLKGANGNLTAKNGIGGTSRESKNTSSLLSSILPMHSSRRNTTLATTNPTKQTKVSPKIHLYSKLAKTAIIVKKFHFWIMIFLTLIILSKFFHYYYYKLPAAKFFIFLP
jgi:hypothetical protein